MLPCHLCRGFKSCEVLSKFAIRLNAKRIFQPDRPLFLAGRLFYTYNNKNFMYRLLCYFAPSIYFLTLKFLLLWLTLKKSQLF